MLGCGLRWLLVLVNFGLVMGDSSRLSFEHDVHCGFVLAWCRYLAARGEFSLGCVLVILGVFLGTLICS